MNKENPRILIVDDEPDITTSFQSYLGKRGFFVDTSTNGKDALALIKVLKPDLVFLDLSLPEMDGRDVLQKLRQYDKETKVIIITGHTLVSAAEKRRILSLGISAYLNKPVILSELEEVIHKILGDACQAPIIPTRESIPTLVDSNPSVGHKLVNLLGIIRNKCESFLLDMEDGISQDKTDKDLVARSVGIMTEVVKTVDRAMDVIEKN